MNAWGREGEHWRQDGGRGKGKGEGIRGGGEQWHGGERAEGGKQLEQTPVSTGQGKSCQSAATPGWDGFVPKPKPFSIPLCFLPDFIQRWCNRVSDITEIHLPLVLQSLDCDRQISQWCHNPVFVSLSPERGSDCHADNYVFIRESGC